MSIVYNGEGRRYFVVAGSMLVRSRSTASIMIDHVGFSVSDYLRAKAFYERALAPLGYKLVMEVTAQ